MKRGISPPVLNGAFIDLHIKGLLCDDTEHDI